MDPDRLNNPYNLRPRRSRTLQLLEQELGRGDTARVLQVTDLFCSNSIQPSNPTIRGVTLIAFEQESSQLGGAAPFSVQVIELICQAINAHNASEPEKSEQLLQEARDKRYEAYILSGRCRKLRDMATFLRSFKLDDTVSSGLAQDGKDVPPSPKHLHSASTLALHRCPNMTKTIHDLIMTTLYRVTQECVDCLVENIVPPGPPAPAVAPPVPATQHDRAAGTSIHNDNMSGGVHGNSNTTISVSNAGIVQNTYFISNASLSASQGTSGEDTLLSAPKAETKASPQQDRNGDTLLDPIRLGETVPDDGLTQEDFLDVAKALADSPPPPQDDPEDTKDAKKASIPKELSPSKSGKKLFLQEDNEEEAPRKEAAARAPIPKTKLSCNRVVPEDAAAFAVRQLQAIKMADAANQRKAIERMAFYCCSPYFFSKSDSEFIAQGVELYQQMEMYDINDRACLRHYKNFDYCLKNLCSRNSEDGRGMDYTGNKAFSSQHEFKKAFKSHDYVLSFANNLLATHPCISRSQFVAVMEAKFKPDIYNEVFHALIVDITASNAN